MTKVKRTMYRCSKVQGGIKMEFDSSRVYTAVNADELAVGDTVIVADDLKSLRDRVEAYDNAYTLEEIGRESTIYRFGANGAHWVMAYLVSKGGSLKWTDLKVGDIIQKGYETCMVMCIDTDPATSLHVCCDKWMSNDDLKGWKKVTYVNDSDF